MRTWIARLVVVSVVPACLAGSVRLDSVRPAAEPGAWEVVAEVPAKIAKNPERLDFRADATPLRVSVVSKEGTRLVLRLTGAPTTFDTLVAGEDAAIRAGASTGPKADLDDLAVYHVMLGYFRNGAPGNDDEIRGWRHPNWAGGDLQGLLEKLDYVRDLGMNAIWISPTFAAKTSHGYDVLNYWRLGDQYAVPGDPAASEALFRKLVAAAHERGIKIVLDLPLNHASKAYDLEAGDPLGLKPKSGPATTAVEKLWDSWGAGFRYWNFGNDATRKFLRAAAMHWLVDEGVDGLRLDYVRGVPHDFWAELYAEVREKKPNAWLVGECWADDAGPDGNAKEIASYYEAVPSIGPQFDSLLDFPAQAAFVDAFARGASAEGLEERLQSDAAAYGPGARPAWFLDNHDMTRFASWSDDPDRLGAAVGFLASLSGPIVLFYGTETGLSSGAPKPGFTDAGRVAMPWGSLDEGRIARVRAALRARAEHPAMRRGARLPLHADRATLVMAKVGGGETLLVGTNVTDAPATATFDPGPLVPAGAKLALVLGAGEVPSPHEPGGMTWTIPAKSTAIVQVTVP